MSCSTVSCFPCSYLHLSGMTPCHAVLTVTHRQSRPKSIHLLSICPHLWPSIHFQSVCGGLDHILSAQIAGQFRDPYLIYFHVPQGAISLLSLFTEDTHVPLPTQIYCKLHPFTPKAGSKHRPTPKLLHWNQLLEMLIMLSLRRH